MKSLNLYEGTQWKTRSGVMRPGGLELTRRLIELSMLPAGTHVLDLGCGRGDATSLLSEAGYNAVGLDGSGILLADACESHPQLDFVKGDAECTPFADESFDGVLLECVLSAVSTGNLLAECARITSSQGMLLISDIYAPTGCGLLSRAWWESRLEHTGFRCTNFEDHTGELKSFAAQMLWDTGSLDGICGCMSYPMPKKPGYFAMIAEKQEVST